jgi:hypothetical protein
MHFRGSLASVITILSTVAVASCGETDEPGLGVIGEALQAPPPALTGSSFEIDSNANLRVDGAGTLDWATVGEIRKGDAATGQGDDSYGGGAKEDDACPPVGTGSIPNNKSDLKYFGAYTEPGAGANEPGFLHLYWSRVQDPTGTTLMDFEFNKSGTACANGINKQRTVGDLLIEYLIDQGGARATVTFRRWQGTVWGPAVDLTATGDATGTINTTAIAAGDADGLGAHSARTFGEASVDLSAIFDPSVCESFGSAMLKSRSSTSFTSQLKDFIAPVGVHLTNCGTAIIRKQTDPDGQAGQFGFSATLPAPAPQAFSLADNGVQTFDNVLFGTGYTVTESGQLPGFELAGIDCSASTGVAASIDGATVTFAIDSVTDVLDCTYTNRSRGTIRVEKITSEGAGTFAFTTATLGAGFSLTTTGPGAAGKASTSFGSLQPGTYDVGEDVPAGWDLASATCSDGSSPSAIALSAGETVTCTFINQRERGAIKILKTRKHAADGPGPHPHAGVTFTVAGGSLGAPVNVVTGADGTACLDGVVLSSFVGGYTVTENLPAGYLPDGALTKDVTVTQASSCGDGHEATVAFGNTPLTNIPVTVDSQVVGGTASTIVCTRAGGAAVGNAATGAGGDGSLSLANLLPDTYTCTILVDP